MTHPPGERPRVIEARASDPANPRATQTSMFASPPGHASHPRVVLAVLCVAQFLAALDVFIVNVALPKIGAGFGESSLSNLSWVLNAYAIVIAALMIPAGRLGDLFGRKRVFLFGMGVFTAASIGAALSGTLWVLVGFRIVQAAGAAAITPTSLGLLMVAAPAEKRAVYVKIWTASAALAAATGPVVGGLLVEASWRWIFLLNVPIGVVAIAAAIRFVPDVAREAGACLPDLLGGGLLVLSIGSLALGLVKAPDWAWSGTATVVAFVIAALSMLAFLWRSARHSDPVLDLDLLRSRVLSSASVSALLYFASFGILLLSSVLWLQGHWHYSPVRTGLAIAPGPCCVPLFAVLSEVAAKRIAVGVIAAFGCVFGRRRILPRAAVGWADAESWDMRHRIPRPNFSPAPRGAEQRCLIRDANEAIEVSNVALEEGAARLAVRCECGDPACLACASLTHAEYEAARACGSHFAGGASHENGESACLRHENTHFAVIDVVVGDGRHQARVRDRRHAWDDAVTAGVPIARRPPARGGSAR
jgi:MFS family permease